ncbi:transposase family protein [Escherichia coli P0298942.1]|uniref:transposase n=1 Tax=Escherichia coli TaxID=562 RepID=UPI0002CAC2D2|nr:transposase [Escherichia coli]ENA21658.1 transposase family protein [Escherichia coli P0298942.1]
MKSLTAVRKKSPNYPVEFKIKMVELSHRPEISVAQLAREHGINDNCCSSGASTGAKETTSSFNNRKQRA